MTPEEAGIAAEQAFLDGYNCTQAVTVVFAERCSLTKEQAARLVSGFGGGMSRLREVCGAVSGMVFVAGALSGYSDPSNGEGKKALYTQVQKLAEMFRAETGSIVCRELLGLPAGKDDPVPSKRDDAYYQKRPCGSLVRLAAEILAREFP